MKVDDIRDQLAEIQRYQYEQLVMAAKSITHNTALAEDVVMDAYVSAITASEQIRNPKSLYKWLRTAVTRNAYKIIHKRKAEVFIENYEQIRAETGWEDETLVRIDTRNALQSLGERNRERDLMIIWLRYFQNLEFKEIAMIMGIPPATARKILQRSLQMLKEHLLDSTG